MAGLTVGKLEKEHAELLEERAGQVARLQELDARLQSGDASLKELRVAADEMAECRRFVEAIDRRLVAVGEQLRGLRQAEQKARVAVLHAEEQDAFRVFCEAVDALQDGPMQLLLDAQKAVRDGGGVPVCAHRARSVVKAVGGFQRMQLMHAHREKAERA